MRWMKTVAPWLCMAVAAAVVVSLQRAPDLSAGAAALAGTNAGSDPAGKQAGQRRILYWWDPMLGPSSISNHPGKSAMGMEMVPVYADEVSRGPELTIDPRVVQEMGVQTAAVTRGPLHQTIRAVGMFKLPDPGMHDVSLRIGGWIDKLYADQEGMHVSKGEPLFELYSQDLQVAAQELIAAERSRRSLPSNTAEQVRQEAERMISSARRKLELWDIDSRQIDVIAKSDQPPKDITFYSPASGHIDEKMAVQGSAVQPGMRLMRIADHSTMWLDAEVYEQQIPLIRIGQRVDVTLDAFPGQTFDGKVAFIYPHLDHMTRTLTVRASFENADFHLRPGMYAQANIVTEPLPDAIQAPREAVIDTGTKQIVFVSQGQGHFAPRTVRTGIRGDDDRIEIVEGLKPGETVVTSGQFLMDVESRTQEAIAKLRGAPEAASAPASASSTEPATTSESANSTGEPSKGESKSLSLIYCPMVKADWLQSPGPVANPYMGAEMRDCGQVKSQLSIPPKDSPLAPIVEAYLAVERSFIAGKYDAKPIEQLKSAADRLKGDSYATLRQAADKLAAARDLKAAQSQFQGVSEALIGLLKNQAAK